MPNIFLPHWDSAARLKITRPDASTSTRASADLRNGKSAELISSCPNFIRGMRKIQLQFVSGGRGQPPVAEQKHCQQCRDRTGERHSHSTNAQSVGEGLQELLDRAITSFGARS